MSQEEVKLNDNIKWFSATKEKCLYMFCPYKLYTLITFQLANGRTLTRKVKRLHMNDEQITLYLNAKCGKPQKSESQQYQGLGLNFLWGLAIINSFLTLFLIITHFMG